MRFVRGRVGTKPGPALPGSSEQTTPPVPGAEEQADGSIDVVFEGPSAEFARKEITDILEAVSKDVRSAPAPGEPSRPASARRSDPDVHGAAIEYDPDVTRRLRRP
jgi:hypothetical protein